MYGVSYSDGLWCLTIRATGNAYYGVELSHVLSQVERPFQ